MDQENKAIRWYRAVTLVCLVLALLARALTDEPILWQLAVIASVVTFLSAVSTESRAMGYRDGYRAGKLEARMEAIEASTRQTETA